MKSDRYSAVICKAHCSYYKPGKDNLACGAYEFLVRNLSLGEISNIKHDSTGVTDTFIDTQINSMACRRCTFRKDGCDFRAGADSPPCGGYIILKNLLSR